MPVEAEAHSDDHVVEVTFDATSYFEQASDDDLLDLAHSDWGGDYPADDVAQHLAEQVPTLAFLFRYIEFKRDVGFECYVNPAQALGWIVQHRPHLAERLTEEEQHE